MAILEARDLSAGYGDGFVVRDVSLRLEPGEFVAPGTPVVTVGDLANAWLRAYVSEADLGRVALFEILPADETIRSMILSTWPSSWKVMSVRKS